MAATRVETGRYVRIRKALMQPPYRVLHALTLLVGDGHGDLRRYHSRDTLERLHRPWSRARVRGGGGCCASTANSSGARAAHGGASAAALAVQSRYASPVQTRQLLGVAKDLGSTHEAMARDGAQPKV